MRLRPPFSLALPVTLALLAAGAASGAGCGGGSGGSGGGGGAGGGAQKKDGTVVVLFTSDEHSHLFAGSPEIDDYPHATAAGSGALVGGVARRAAVLARERKAASDAGKDSITVSAGDNQMGTLVHAAFETASIDYRAMKALGYDATTLGNHEFDFGPQTLVKSIKTAQDNGGLPPIVASNIHFSELSPDDDELAALYSDKQDDAAPINRYRVITTKGGIKVGILGFVGVNAERVVPSKKPVKFSSYALPGTLEGDTASVLPEMYKELQPVVDTLRNTEKVDLVVALSHSGLGNSLKLEDIQQSEDYLIAQNVAGIDLIVSGHAHNTDPTPYKVTNAASGRDTLILNAGAYGAQVGRIAIMVHADGSPPMFDMASQELLPVDDQTVPDPTLAQATDGYLTTIEKASFGGGGSYLEGMLSRVTGTSVKDDAAKPGDLYFYPIGKTAFDVTNTASLLALSSDSMLASADAWGAASSTKTDIGLESAGVIRSVLKKGKTGVITAADAFNVVSLGVSDADKTLGYPLVHATITLLELRGVFEASVVLAKTNDQYNLLTAGAKVEYDDTRPPALGLTELLDPAKGKVMRILVDTDHADGYEQFDKVVYDREKSIGSPTDTFSVVTSSYIATFAADVGASPQGLQTMKRADQSEIKQLEAFMSFIKAAPGGTLPSLYDAASPSAAKRVVCINGCP